jgi:hypothetical protein
MARVRERSYPPSVWDGGAAAGLHLDSISPATVVAVSGVTLTCRGTGFLTPAPVLAVMFVGPAPATDLNAATDVTIVSDTELTVPNDLANVPGVPGVYTVWLGDGADGSNSIGPFTVTATAGTTEQAAPAAAAPAKAAKAAKAS